MRMPVSRPQRKAAIEAKARIHVAAAGAQPSKRGRPSASPRARAGTAGAGEERRTPARAARPGAGADDEGPEAAQAGPSAGESEEEEEELAEEMPRAKEEGDEKAGPSGGAAKKDAEEEASTAPLPERVRGPARPGAAAEAHPPAPCAPRAARALPASLPATWRRRRPRAALLTPRFPAAPGPARAFSRAAAARAAG